VVEIVGADGDLDGAVALGLLEEVGVPGHWL
jgi:hypothetical protein